MNNFTILSYEEENKLAKDEKKTYYIELKKYLQQCNYSVNYKLYLKICESLNKNVVRDAINIIKGYELFIENRNLIPNGPVIYASTHQDFNDHFNVVLSIPEHAIILNSINVPKVIKMLMNINGIEYVDRANAESKFNAKINLMKHLSKGKSIVVFPEATYNCSPNKLILPLHSGVIDMAKKIQVPIVPLVQEYNYHYDKLNYKEKINSCTVRFGNPIYVSYNDSIKEKKDELRDCLASLRYDIISKKGIFERNQITTNEYISFLLSRLHTLSLMGVDYQIEKNAIYGVDDEMYKYYPVNAVLCNDNKELSKIKKMI